MFRGVRRVFVVLGLALALPACAHATTVRIGPETPASSLSAFLCLEGCPGGETLAQIVTPGVPFDEAPASGLITTWRVTGSTGLRLRVFHQGPAGEWVTAGTSAPGTNGKGEPNATSLPVRAGDVIGLDEPAGHNNEVGDSKVGASTALLFRWGPALGEDVVAPKPVESSEEVILVNADVVLAPVVSALSPTSGGAAGGTAVTITGKYLDGATGVTFGATPASSFGVNSPNQITAIAPTSAASTVDVHVTGPGGLSETSSGDRYTYTAPATTPTVLPPALPPVSTLLAPTALSVSGFSESAARWRRGKSLPRISRAGAPVGTLYTFSLNEPASVSFAFTQQVAGRRVGGRCVAPGHSNLSKPKCRRTLRVASFSLAGHTGLNKVRFQGRVSSAKTLQPGAYRVTIGARDARGLRAVSQALGFTILAG